MKRALTIIAAATITAAGLIACDRPPSQPSTPAVPKQQMGTAPANTANPAANPQNTMAKAPDSAPAADRELSNKVKNALTTSNGVEIGAVDVAAADGVVTINGTVQMPAEKDRAAILALNVDGVRSVVNNLVVIRGS